MSWASRRRTLYISIIVALAIVFLGVPAAYFLYQEPTCDDGRQNQGETAIDKGGPCDLLDETAIIPEAILFARAFPIRDGEYGMTAYVQNLNREAGVALAKYRFSVYDEKNVLVAERDGVASLLPGAITPIYEPSVKSGERVVARTFFEFTEPLSWVKAVNPNKPLLIENIKTSDLSGQPRITAEVNNTAIEAIQDTSFVVTVFDSVGNAFASSRTTVQRIPGGERTEISFTWPRPFPYAPARVDILPVSALSFE